MKKLSLLLCAILILTGFSQANAQTPEPGLLGSTTALPSGVAEAVMRTLANNPPSNARNYVITYIQENGAYSWLVCVAGTNVDNPQDFEFSDSMVWAGTLVISQSAPGEDWQGEYYQSGIGGSAKRAALHVGTGGGANVLFPFQAGANAMYGVSGVHGEGEYGSSGIVFVDLFGGSNMGNNVMSDRVYASAGGEVDYVCEDDQNVAIRVNKGAGEVYYYVHLIDNSNLTLGHTFNTGSLIGRLKHGTFTGSDPVACGSANQQASSYHVHWGFAPKNGQFQANNWILNVSKETWSDGKNTIRPGQYLSNPGKYCVDCGDEPPDDGGTGENIVSFWDLIILGLYAIASAIVGLLPQHTSNGIGVAMVTGIGVVLRIFYVMADSVLNLTVAFLVFIVICILEGIRLVITTLRFVKKYVPGLA